MREVAFHKPIRERTGRLRDTLLRVKPKIYSERALLLTESMKETEGHPMIVRRAKGLEKILNEMTILIWPAELIVGNQAPEPRCAPVFPEFGIHNLIEELDGEPMRPEERPGDKFLISEMDEATVRRIAPWWRGKTVEEYKDNLLSDQAYKGYRGQRAFSIHHGMAGGGGHLTVDYPEVLRKGLSGIIRGAEDELMKLEVWKPEDFEKRYFLEAVIIVLRAAVNFGNRFSRLAKETAEKEQDPSRKAELGKIAEHCSWVPANPARTFWEAMQSLWFIHLVIQLESNGHSISFGRFDQYMLSFYERDMASGRIKLKDALELIECLFIKSQEINKFRCWAHTQHAAGFPMFQNLTLGGQTRDERPAINDLSWLCLDAAASLKLSQPSISVRCWKGMPEEFLLKCIEVINIHRGGQPALFNDEVIIPSQLALGVSREDAYDYAINSCVQPCEPGKGMKVGSLLAQYNFLKILEITLNNGMDPRSGIQLNPNPGGKDIGTFGSFEELLSAFKQQIEFYNKLMVSGINCVSRALAELTPTPFASALMDDCIKRGRDLHWGGGRYNTAGPIQVGLANVGNCLAALKNVMFEKKRLTAEQIKHALETNFEDDTRIPTGEEIRRILLQAPKYGNDDDYADLLVKEVFEFAAKDVTKYVVYGTGARCNTNFATVAGNVPMGKVIGATPDGRKAGMPTNEAMSPVQGTDVSGPTATLKSVAKLNHTLCADGGLLNQKFSPVSFHGLGQVKRIMSLVKTYFALGGIEIQFNVVSAETLRDARKHPEKYPNLLIRVAGYSAFFTTLASAVQDDIISRTEQSLV